MKKLFHVITGVIVLSVFSIPIEQGLAQSQRVVQKTLQVDKATELCDPETGQCPADTADTYEIEFAYTIEENNHRGWYVGGAAGSLPWSDQPGPIVHLNPQFSPISRCDLFLEHQHVYNPHNHFLGYSAHTYPTDPEWDTIL